MKTIIVAVVIIVAAVVGAIVLRPDAATNTTTNTTVDTAITSTLDTAVTVRLGVFPNVTHAPGLIAIGRDLIHDLLPNATIEVNAFNSGTTATEALFADAIDLTYIGPNPALNAYAKSDGDAVRIVSGSTSGGAFLVVRPEITSAEQLRGKKIATPSLGNTQDVALRSWLAEQGLETDTAGGGDVSVVPQENAQTLDTFLSGTIDGAWVPEPWASRLIGEGGATVLVDERDLWPDGQYVTTHLMVATQFLADHPDVVSRIVLANTQAVDYANDHPAEARELVNDQIEEFTQKRMTDEVLRSSWENLSFTVDPVANSLQASADDAVALDFIDPIDNLAGIYDLTLLNGVLAALGRDGVTGL